MLVSLSKRQIYFRDIFFRMILILLIKGINLKQCCYRIAEGTNVQVKNIISYNYDYKYMDRYNIQVFQ